MTDPERPWTDGSADELVRKYKDLCVRGYSNPGHVGCPGNDVLERLAERNPDEALSDELISHVATCSPCYQTYTAYLVRTRTRRRYRLAALSTAAVLLLVFGAMAVRIFIVQSGPASISTTEVEQVPDEATQEKVVRPMPAPQPVEWAKATLDLRDLSGSRGEGEPPAQPKELRRGRLELLILLPTGSPSGQYEIALAEGDGRVLLSESVDATVRAGETSAVAKLDLSEVPAGNLRFGHRRLGSDWVWCEVRVP